MEKSRFVMASPESLGITSASLLNLLEEIERRHINFHSLMVLRHGRAAVRLWWKPYSHRIPHQMYSFSKSVLAAAVGIACAEGSLCLDDRIASFFPRRIKTNADERIYSVTVEHLLTMTSGAVLQNEAGTASHTDWVEWFLNTPLSGNPGKKFTYNSMNSYMLAAVLRRATGKGLVDYLMPRLFEPLGIERPMWDKCPMGIECGGWGLYLTTEDMANFCQLCLEDGVRSGKRILPAGWAAEAGRDRIAEIAGDGRLNDSMHRTAGYGYHFWRNGDGCSWRADGMFGQYGLILPQKDMVIVSTGGHPRQMEMLDVFYDAFIPYVDDIPEGSRTGGDYNELCRVSKRLSCPAPGRCDTKGMERKIPSNTVFDIPRSRYSLLPLAVRYLHRAGTTGVRAIGLEFDNTRPAMRWDEDGATHLIPFDTQGKICTCDLACGGRTYPAATSAAWVSDDTLEIGIRLLCTAHMVRVSFRFEGDEVICTFDEDPSIEDTLRMLFDLSQHMRPLAERLARLTRSMLLPVRGKKRSSE